MYFVGREKEIGQITEALEEGKNVIVSGKYGMGRTRLVQYVAEGMRKQWRFFFADFSKTPGAICHHLVRELFPGQEFRREYMRYKSSRFRIVSLDFSDKRRHVLVLDNIAKLSSQKIDFIRYLAWEKRFQFVAIVENFVSESDLMRLRVGIHPATMIELRRLSISHVTDFFRNLSKTHEFHWTEAQIKNLSQASGGYPLRMREIARRELERNRQRMNSTVEAQASKRLIGYSNKP